VGSAVNRVAQPFPASCGCGRRVLESRLRPGGLSHRLARRVSAEPVRWTHRTIVFDRTPGSRAAGPSPDARTRCASVSSGFKKRSLPAPDPGWLALVCDNSIPRPARHVPARADAQW